MKLNSKEILVQIQNTFNQWLYLTSTDTLEVVAATYLANKLAGQRLWLALIGPSSCGKTTYAESLLGLSYTHALDAITPGTFASGYRHKGGPEKYGLFEQLNDGNHHMIIVRDFSTVLRDLPHVKSKAMAQLRCIYDGTWNQNYGTGIDVAWEGKVGMIICATPNYEREVTSEATFGERFIQWKMRIPDQRKLAERAMQNAGKTDVLRADLKSVMKKLGQIKVPTDITLPLGVIRALSEEAVFVARARTPVERDRFSYEESTSRLAGQLAQLMKGLVILHGEGEPHQEDFEIVEQCAFSCIPKDRLYVMATIGSDEVKGSVLEAESKMPKTVLYRVMDDMKELGLLENVRATSGDRRERAWRAPDEWVKFFHRARKVVERALDVAPLEPEQAED